MQTTKMSVLDRSGTAIVGSKAIVWGNNAAWLCVGEDCGELLGNRTGDSEYVVTCPRCRTRYEIGRSPNKSGDLHLGAATGVRCR